MASRGKRVSISSIGKEIRKKQKDLRAKKRGASPRDLKKINLHLQKLERTYKQLRLLCRGGWNIT